METPFFQWLSNPHCPLPKKKQNTGIIFDFSFFHTSQILTISKAVWLCLQNMSTIGPLVTTSAIVSLISPGLLQLPSPWSPAFTVAA